MLAQLVNSMLLEEEVEVEAVMVVDMVVVEEVQVDVNTLKLDGSRELMGKHLKYMHLTSFKIMSGKKYRLVNEQFFLKNVRKLTTITNVLYNKSVQMKGTQFLATLIILPLILAL